MQKIKDITSYLESISPLAYQEDYDNAGLLTGDENDEIIGALISLDCTEEVVEEAISKKCNLIIAHHPIVFKGLKRFTGKNYIERTIIKAIKNDIAIYAIHTNLDNVIEGVSSMIAKKLSLINPSILSPKSHLLSKLEFFVPKSNADEVKNALHIAGAGNIGNYSKCSFSTTGVGSFLPNDKAQPKIGSVYVQENVSEERIEVIFPSYLETKIIKALKTIHPYEEVAYYITQLRNMNQEVGSGIIAELTEPMPCDLFLKYLKEKMNLQIIRHTQKIDKPIHKIAICGGSGSFLLSKAIQSGADAFITADFKYHEFFDAEQKLMICDIGHYESEVFTKDLIFEVINKKFPTFALCLTEVNTNPISYF